MEHHRSKKAISTASRCLVRKHASGFKVDLPGCTTADPTLEKARQVKALVVEMDWATTNRTRFLAEAARAKPRDTA